MAYPEITAAIRTIHRTDAPRHFMRIKPVDRQVRILRNGVVLADTSNALRLTEVGHDIYDPVFYIPQSDVIAELAALDGKSTYCPLKGDACYWTLHGVEIAWMYDRPLSYGDELKGHIAFAADEVSVEEHGPRA
ncbi:MAG: DUF427 domain-containing protein [Pseudomonadota bacterium]